MTREERVLAKRLGFKVLSTNKSWQVQKLWEEAIRLQREVLELESALQAIRKELLAKETDGGLH